MNQTPKSSNPPSPPAPRRWLRPIHSAVSLALTAWLCVAASGFEAFAQEGFTHFEARQTHPVGLTPDGTRLLVLNSADARLCVFDISNPANPEPVLLAEIPVGLEPVSLRARTDNEVWVVNEVSDSVSIVSLGRRAVVASLPCPDEPADIVFASGKAFVSCARNGVLRVFDTTNRTEIGVVPLGGNVPRYLAASADGTRVFASFQLSGNRTTVLPSNIAPAQPAPWNTNLPAPPDTALIVPASDPRIAYKVLDRDVVEVSAANHAVLRYISDVGTCLFDLVPRPGTDELWVANTEALNLVRFEPNLKGHFADNRLTRIALTAGTVAPFDLNPGIDYGVLPNPAAQATALAQPMSAVFAPDGSAMWVAAFASDRVARIDPSDGTVLARVDVRIPPADGVTNDSTLMRGPRGLALHAGLSRLFVLNKLANSVSVIDTATAAVIAEVPAGSLHPLPVVARRGRGFLFDARLSGNGTVSCGTCHLDADLDGLAWDLGDPNGAMLSVIGADLSVHDTTPKARAMHPMKGPMITQTLRGIQRTNLLHWRGDRATVQDFNPTFRDLMGGALRSEAEMAALAEYLFGLRHHPNPNRQLNNSLPATLNGASVTNGFLRFNAHVNHCGVCHAGPTGSDNNVDDLRNFGGAQPIKTPSLATTYQRALLDTRSGATNVSGFGLLHNGTGGNASLPTVHFYELDILNGQAFAEVEAYVRSFDTGTSPAVGALRTVTSASAADTNLLASLTMIESQAGLSNGCDLVVRGSLGGRLRHFLFDRISQRYRPDVAGEASPTRAELLALLGPDDSISFLGVPPGLGSRMGVDRNGDGIPDAGQPGPRLQLDRGIGTIALRWPMSPADWVLESSPFLAAPWSADLRPRLRTNELFELNEPASDGSTRFFRLRRTW